VIVLFKQWFYILKKGELFMASRFKLCSFKTCPWVHRAAIVLQEKGIDYEIEYIDRHNRPEWFLEISPHSKVPVLIVDGEHALFESNAIAEYLDEVAEPRLHPEDPILRARNRAWTDFVPTFSQITHISNALDQEDFKIRVEKAQIPVSRLEGALEKRGNKGPFFNGEQFSLVDAAYAPPLLRFTYLDRVRPTGLLDGKPLLSDWRDALISYPAVLKGVVPEFHEVWQDQVRTNGKWVVQFLPTASAAE
jgi:glutathione S-transferase